MIVGHTMFGLAAVPFVYANTTCPGRVPVGWKPDYATEQQMADAVEYERLKRRKQARRDREKEWGKMPVRFCARCEEFKPPRSHHCRECNACTLKMDHHCPWVGNCVGLKNQKYFVVFLIYASVGLLYAVVIYLWRLIQIFTTYTIFVRRRGGHRVEDEDMGSGEDVPTVQIILLVTNLLIMIPICLSLFCLMSYQLGLVFENLTTIEEYENHVMKRKAERNGDKWKWYYDLGWRENTIQVLGDKIYMWFLPVPHVSAPNGLSYLTHDKQTV
eukprot:CAMPEP_0174271958 /NCGR_PEP_ID=MMETSP0439-20130205/49581_1 /TAXON_ID=0 /ORGANISM="Stereomyxa ramosa, Strain Chinc5" /LENGTH=271 /DNA_ID=CAMNT_0015362255 /DNA_START=74 /DNA_END=889 /DNA_ORIENTATION=+